MPALSQNTHSNSNNHETTKCVTSEIANISTTSGLTDEFNGDQKIIKKFFKQLKEKPRPQSKDGATTIVDEEIDEKTITHEWSTYIGTLALEQQDQATQLTRYVIHQSVTLQEPNTSIVNILKTALMMSIPDYLRQQHGYVSWRGTSELDILKALTVEINNSDITFKPDSGRTASKCFDNLLAEKQQSDFLTLIEIIKNSETPDRDTMQKLARAFINAVQQHLVEIIGDQDIQTAFSMTDYSKVDILQMILHCFVTSLQCLIYSELIGKTEATVEKMLAQAKNASIYLCLTLPILKLCEWDNKQDNESFQPSMDNLNAADLVNEFVNHYNKRIEPVVNLEIKELEQRKQDELDLDRLIDDTVFLETIKQAYSPEHSEDSEDRKKFRQAMQAVDLAILYPEIIKEDELRNDFANLACSNPVSYLRLAHKFMCDNPELSDEINNNISGTTISNKEIIAEIDSGAIQQELNILQLVQPHYKPLSLGPIRYNVKILAQRNENRLLREITRNVLPKTTNTTWPTTYEAQLYQSLIDSETTLPPYFNATRIEQYLLDQIAIFQKNGKKVGGAPAMINIIQSSIDLSTKLQLLADIGTGKSNNSPFSLSRFARNLRQDGLAKFYKNLELFSELQSPEQATDKFMLFLNKSGIEESHLHKVEEDIQRYTLIRANLEALDLKHLPFPLNNHLKNLRSRPSISDLSPIHIFAELEYMKRFLKDHGIDVQKAIATNTMVTDENHFEKFFRYWVNFAILNKAVVTLDELLLMNRRPNANSYISCLEFLGQSQDRLDKSSKKNLRIFLKITVLKIDQKTQRDIISKLVEKSKTAPEKITETEQKMLNSLFLDAKETNNKQLLSAFSHALGINNGYFNKMRELLQNFKSYRGIGFFKRHAHGVGKILTCLENNNTSALEKLVAIDKIIKNRLAENNPLRRDATICLYNALNKYCNNKLSNLPKPTDDPLQLTDLNTELSRIIDLYHQPKKASPQKSTQPRRSS